MVVFQLRPQDLRGGVGRIVSAGFDAGKQRRGFGFQPDALKRNARLCGASFNGLPFPLLGEDRIRDDGMAIGQCLRRLGIQCGVDALR